MTELFTVLNRSTLAGEFPAEDSCNDDSLAEIPSDMYFPGEAINATYAVAPRVSLPRFARDYIDVYGAYYKDVVPVMHMLANGLCREHTTTLECVITPLPDELEYHFHWQGSDAIVFFSEDAVWGIEGRKVITLWMDLYREKFGDQSVSVRVCEA